MAKVVKKADPKKVEKAKVMEIVEKALVEAGYSVGAGPDYGFTEGTVVVHGAKCDVQLKPITPKVGLDRYVELVDEDEEEAVEQEKKEEEVITEEDSAE
jgi:hypothetical protein